MSYVLCPGSFDPVTNGHLDIIRRAAGVFDRVTVLVATNLEKKYLFTTPERVDMIARCITDLENVDVKVSDGLLMDYAREHNATAVVKGLRAISDFEYEFQMALTNRTLNPDCDTIFFATGSRYMFLSSSIVRQVGSLGGDISRFVPEILHDEIKAKLLETGERPCPTSI